VRLELEPAAGPAVAWGDAASLEQLLMNLAYNARDAMPGGGVLSVKVGVRAGDGGAPGFARISVRDTGAGIEPEVQARIFEPFYTTKGRGRGTGLGLSISHAIIQDHQGTIGAENRPEGGALFRFTLPLGGTPPQVEPEQEQPHDAQQDTNTAS